MSSMQEVNWSVTFTDVLLFPVGADSCATFRQHHRVHALHAKMQSLLVAYAPMVTEQAVTVRRSGYIEGLLSGTQPCRLNMLVILWTE